MHKTLWLFLSLIWTAIIVFLCLINGKSLPEISLGFSGFDKLVHAVFYFVFTLTWSVYFHKKRKSSKKIVSIVFLSGLSLGILIELFQEFFTQDRKADFFDVLANIAGATLASFLFFQIQKKYNNSKNS